VRLGSLRQLTLASFVLALVPLIALLWQSQNDLAKVGKMTHVETRYVVDVVGLMQQLDGAAIDLERALRQYAIIRNETVATLTDNAIIQFIEALRQLCDTLPDSATCDTIKKDITQLKTFRNIDDTLLLNAYLNSLSNNVALMRKDVDIAIQQRLEVQKEDLNAMQAKQAWSTAMLVSVSLLLILLGSQLIVNPVKKLKQIIRILAQEQGELPPLSTKAPTELIGVEKDLHWLADRLGQLEHIRTALLRHAAKLLASQRHTAHYRILYLSAFMI